MKTLTLTVAVVTVVFALQVETRAQGHGPAHPVAHSTASHHSVQPHYRHLPSPVAWSHAATAYESYARAHAAMMYAQGQQNLLNAQAQLVYTEAYRRGLENREQAVASYFAVRDLNREARANERRQGAAEGRSPQLSGGTQSSGQAPQAAGAATGEIHWPELLQGDEFGGFRAEIEAAFARRAANRELSSQDLAKLRQTTNGMLEELKTQVRNVRPDEYAAARRFIVDLAREAALPVS